MIPKRIPDKTSIKESRVEFVAAAALLPLPNILIEGTIKQVLHDTKPQVCLSISLGESLETAENLVSGDGIIRGLIDLRLQMRALGILLKKINTNQPKTLRKKKGEIGFSRGQKVSTAKAMIKSHMDSGITLALLNL
jgi:hypothetical protein